MEEIEPKNSGEIPQVVEDFDLNYERFLEFYEKDYHGDSIKEYLDSLIEKGTLKGWVEIAVTCRRMIICDRELDLEKGTELMKKTLDTFKKLKPEDRPYEAIRYINTCGLISFRRGDYSSASEYFEQAKEMATKFNMKCFIPDMTSNAIRAKFDLFRYTLPPGQIRSGDIEYYQEHFNGFINDFKAAIDELSEYKTDDKRLKLIYYHGMASLYHNLGDIYGAAEDRKVFGSELADLKDKRKTAHEQSLDCGKKVDDKYRQLQSKDQLCKCYGAEMQSTIKEYEKNLLTGNWARGKQFVLQRKIKESKDTDYINDLIRGNVKFDDELIKVEGGLKIDENEEDKIVAIHNYDAIKTAIKKGVKCIKDKNEKDMPLLDIANNKIKVVKKLRKEFYQLYRRQAIHLIWDDVLEIIDDFWDKKYWKEVINTSERYSCRDLIELAQISLAEGLKPTDEQQKKINQYKKDFLVVDEEEIKKHSKSNLNIPLSLTLDDKTHENSRHLILAYESVLERASKDFEWPEWDVYEKLKGSLRKISTIENTTENTAVLKFLIHEQKGQKKKVGRVLLIKNEEEIIKREFDLDFVKDAKDAIKGIERVMGEMGKSEISFYDKMISYENTILSYKKSLCKTMADLSKKLELDEELKDVKNLFIIPDGELFQLPLHLMFKEIQKSNKMNVYYSPTLTHLLTPPDYDIINNNKAANYLWVLCPTDDLCKGGKPLLNHPDYDYEPLQCKDATLHSFKKNYKPREFTHIGFSTHGVFHDYSKDAYVSQILFNKSFLTPYDIIFYCNFSGVQTVFLGCCEVGSSKYTDENEAIGLVTAFLSKKAVSVIAPLWKIDNITHDSFIKAVDKSGIAKKAWNLADIFCDFENLYESIPFVQYASIGIVVGRLQEEKQEEILSYLRENDPSPYNPKETV